MEGCDFVVTNIEASANGKTLFCTENMEDSMDDESENR